MFPLGAVFPLCSCAFRFGTTVVLATTSGAVPVATVLVIGWLKEFCPVKALLEARVMGRTVVNSLLVTPVAVIE